MKSFGSLLRFVSQFWYDHKQIRQQESLMLVQLLSASKTKEDVPKKDFDCGRSAGEKRGPGTRL